jgi:hypothetical protein
MIAGLPRPFSEISTAASTATTPAGGDAQWPSSRPPSAFNTLKVESLVTWLYTSIVTAIWLWRSICRERRFREEAASHRMPPSCAKNALAWFDGIIDGL